MTGKLKQENNEIMFDAAAFELQRGTELWSHSLPVRPVAWGLAIDRDGCVIVTLKDGTITCFGPKTVGTIAHESLQ